MNKILPITAVGLLALVAWPVRLDRQRYAPVQGAVKRLRCFLLLVLGFSSAHASFMAPDVVATLRKLDANGRELWRQPLPRSQIPYRVEVYARQVVVYARMREAPKSPAAGPETQVWFFGAERGVPVAPFDTRLFLMPEHDPLLASSGDPLSLTDQRGEIVLPNKWVSYGAKAPTEMGHKVHFFERNGWNLKWTLTLPQYVHAVRHWHGTLIYRQMFSAEGKAFARLYGHIPGQESPAWEFMLPPDVPDFEIRSDSPGVSRTFDYAIGQSEILVFGNGRVFALEPTSGKVMWRTNILDDAGAAKALGPDTSGEILDCGPAALVVSRAAVSAGVLIRLEKSHRSNVTVLRQDIHFAQSPVVHGGFIYCMTQAEPNVPVR